MTNILCCVITAEMHGDVTEGIPVLCNTELVHSKRRGRQIYGHRMTAVDSISVGFL